MRGDPPHDSLNSNIQILSTPHARGSTFRLLPPSGQEYVYPACAGIHPRLRPPIRLLHRLPRMRGDPPLAGCSPSRTSASTPHARGSTLNCLSFAIRSFVYPACAGIHRFDRERELTRYRLPRMRGDPPQEGAGKTYCRRSTPHARGSTRLFSKEAEAGRVYPACAGIHLCLHILSSIPHGLPRMRGDPPRGSLSRSGARVSTPHARGSTLRSVGTLPDNSVYPACAGIHL